MYYKKLKPNAKEPVRGSEYAAGYDLTACFEDVDEFEIQPHQTYKVGTGIAMQIPTGCFGAVFARSGLATKFGLRPANCVGVIDSDYRGEIIVALHNDTDYPQVVENGERIAQIVIMPYMPFDLEETDSLDETQRGDNGFGSTGLGIDITKYQPSAIPLAQYGTILEGNYSANNSETCFASSGDNKDEAGFTYYQKLDI